MGEFLDFIYRDYKYKLYVPSKYNSENEFPLLVMLHGCEQYPDDFAAGTGMNTLAEKESFLVLYPDMNHPLDPRNPSEYNPFGCWNWFLNKNQHREAGHPKLIYGMIQEVKSNYRIDSDKVYAAGLSAGGSLACILGVTYPDIFNGIGICSGLAYSAANVFFLTDPMGGEAKNRMEKGVPDPYECGNRAYQEMGEYQKKMPVIVFHGIGDTTVHPINGQQAITQWGQTNFLIDGGSGRADISPALMKSDIMNGRSYTQHVYHDRDGEPLMELWLIDQMGHTWSGGSLDGSYTDPSGPNATEMIWSFFSQHPQPQEQTQSEASAELLYLQNISPRESPDQPPVQLPEQALSPSSVTPPVQTPAETENEAEAEAETATETEVEAPKKNLFKALLAKVLKKKK